MKPAIYLDGLSTTPPDPRVLEAMEPYVAERFGHPASRQHAFGWDAERAVEEAREQVAALLGAPPREIVFTSGGTESDNLAIKGVAEALETRGRHLVVSSIEHRPVRASVRWLAHRGWEVTEVGVDARARVDPGRVAAAVRDDTVLVSIVAANAEVGTVQDLAAIGAACAERGVAFHVDAAQAAAWIPLDVGALGIGLLSLAGHRMFGPKGIGALYVRRRVPLAPLLHGGGHERGRRSGTVPVAAAVGLGRAAQLCRLEREQDAGRAAALRDRLEAALEAGAGGVEVLGDPAHRLPHVSALALEGCEGEALLLGVPSVAFATGSACSSATLEPSYVLAAMGLPKVKADTSVRFGLGRFTTEAEIDEAAARLVEAIARIRALNRP